MLTRDQLVAHCLSKPATDESFPFNPVTAVYKVMGKMFALIPNDAPSISLKCDPELARILRETYPAVRPGYHLNKKHWNTVTIDGTIPDDEILEMIDNSFGLVVRGLKKADRDKLEQMG